MFLFVVAALGAAALWRLAAVGGVGALLLYAWAGARVDACAWLRRRFAPRWLRSAFGGLVRSRALRRVARRAHRRQYVFAVAPHGAAADGLVAGFACHGVARDGALRRMLDGTRVVAHGAVRALPGVRELYAVFGAVPHWRADVDAALRSGAHIALAPSGLAGALRCIGDAAPPAGAVNVYRRPARAGFCALAARRGAHIVPVLVLDTTRSWRCLGARWLPPLLAVHVKTRRPVRCVVGAPIAAAAYATRVDALAERYYAALRELGAQHGVRVRVLPTRIGQRAPARSE